MPPLTNRSALMFLLLVDAACSSSTVSARSTGDAPAPFGVDATSEPREQTADEQIQHVLNRLAFGPRPGDVATVRGLGVDRWIALQLASDRGNDAETDRLAASYEMLNRPTRDLVQSFEQGRAAIRRLQNSGVQQGADSNAQKSRADILRNNPALREIQRQNQRMLGGLQSVRLARAVVSDRQLDEVMTDFWENHFTIFAGKGLDRVFLPAYDRDVIRPNALGSFRTLLGAVAKSPAMLFYLDQWQSVADSLHPTLGSARKQPASARAFRAGAPAARKGLNENYARELLELHTLGVDGGYTQQDVVEVARALTGWTMNPRANAEFVFRPDIHDSGPKVVLGHRLPAGRGIEDGEDVLDILARDPHTARFIAHKLAVRFLSDSPPEAIVERAARTFTRTGGDIREVVRTIVTSPEFFSRSAYRSKVKSPFELVASALRAVGAQADTSVRSAQMVAFLGAPIFGHQAPNGWPETGDAWMNSGAILNRINFGLGLAAGRFPGASVAAWSEAEQLKSATREQQVDAVVNAFLGGRASPDTRQILLRGENPLAVKFATLAMKDSASSDVGPESLVPQRPLVSGAPARMDGRPRFGVAGQIGQQVQLNGLPQMVGLAIGAPEFQHR